MISGVPKTVPPSVPPSPPQHPPRRDRGRIRTGLPWFLRNISEPYVCNTKRSKRLTQKPRFQGRDGPEPSPPPGSPENRSEHSRTVISSAFWENSATVPLSFAFGRVITPSPEKHRDTAKINETISTDFIFPPDLAVRAKTADEINASCDHRKSPCMGVFQDFQAAFSLLPGT